MKIERFVAGMVIVPMMLLSQEIATAQELGEFYDLNRDGYLDNREFGIYKVHAANPFIRKYDVITVNGRLDASELEKLYAETESNLSDPAVLAAVSPVDALLIEYDNRIPIGKVKLEKPEKLDAAIAETRKLLDTNCDFGERAFLRRDKIDMSIYNKKLGVAEKKGASALIKDDHVTDETVAQINAAAAYVLYRNTCPDFPEGHDVEDAFASGWSLAAFADFNGNLSSAGPSKEKNYARFGLDGQLELQGGLFNYQYLTVGPYVQTDFRGDGLAYGFEASWQPVQIDYHLSVARADPYLEWYWTPILRADLLTVEEQGSMGNLRPGSHYAWLGGDFELTVNILPSMFQRRLYANAGASIYWDAASNDTIGLYSAGIAYNLDPQGYSSISAEYSHGTPRATLKFQDQLNVGLNFKY